MWFMFQQTKYIPMRYCPIELTVHMDLVTLDNALGNSYVKHLISGKSLNTVYNTFMSSLQTIVSSDTQVNIDRSLSKMKSV